MGRPSRRMKASSLPGWALLANSRAAARNQPMGDNEARAGRSRAAALARHKALAVRPLLGEVEARAIPEAARAARVRSAGSRLHRAREVRPQTARTKGRTLLWGNR